MHVCNNMCKNVKKENNLGVLCKRNIFNRPINDSDSDAHN